MANSAAASFDTTGMDPAMKRTLKGEAGRKDRLKAMFAPFARLDSTLMARMPESFREMHAYRKNRRKKIAAARAAKK